MKKKRVLKSYNPYPCGTSEIVVVVATTYLLLRRLQPPGLSVAALCVFNFFSLKNNFLYIFYRTNLGEGIVSVHGSEDIRIQRTFTKIITFTSFQKY
jgi:hypothetical protein